MKDDWTDSQIYFVLAEWVGSIGGVDGRWKTRGVLIATVSFCPFFFSGVQGDGARQGHIHYAARARLLTVYPVTSYDTQYTLGMEILACLVCLARLARLGTQPPCVQVIHPLEPLL